MNEETLTLYYYGELSPHERRDVERALESNAPLRESYEALSASLDALRQHRETAAPDDAVRRWHDAISRAAQREQTVRNRGRRWLQAPSIAWGAIVTAVLVAGIAIGVSIPDRDGPAIVPDDTLARIASPSSAFERGLRVHLAKSRQDISAMPADTGGDRASLILQLIEQNQLFERAAEQNGSDDLARVLRAFEPVLLRLAAADISPQEAEQLQAQLAFELKVMLTKLRDKASDDSNAI